MLYFHQQSSSKVAADPKDGIKFSLFISSMENVDAASSAEHYLTPRFLSLGCMVEHFQIELALAGLY